MIHITHPESIHNGTLRFAEGTAEIPPSIQGDPYRKGRAVWGASRVQDGIGTPFVM